MSFNRDDWAALAGKPVTLPLLAIIAAIVAVFCIGVLL